MRNSARERRLDKQITLKTAHKANCDQLSLNKFKKNHSNGPEDSSNQILAALKNSTLKDWHPDDQPRERLQKLGAETLANHELLAILLRSGTQTSTAIEVAQNLLLEVGGQLRALKRKNWRDLASIHGIGKVKAITIVAALELSKRIQLEEDIKKANVTSSLLAKQLLAPHLGDLNHEECWVLWLNTARKLILKERLSIGGVDGTVVDIRKLMAMGLRNNASAFILAHNHPSGNLKPSKSDVYLTEKAIKAGHLLDIKLEDHLIIAGTNYYSFRDEGQIEYPSN